MADIVARRCMVSGRVQGVWYRASTRARADELGLTGHARNLEDGRVEVIACGEREAVAALCDWLWMGSPGSSVKAVEIEELEPEALGGLPGSFRTL